MMACVLQRLGVRSVVVDGKAGPTTESRALVVQARSMELYDQLGLVDEVLAQATQARWLAPGLGSRAFGRIPLGALGAGLTPFPRVYVLEQSKNERILLDGLRRLGGDVHWRHALTALADVAGGVEARVAGPDGELRITARYCVGADGSGSLVRRLRGIAFDGTTNDETFFVTDAVDVRGLVADAVNVRPGGRDFLLAFPMGPPADFRLIGIARAIGDGRDTAGELTEQDTREQLRAGFAVTYGPSRWFSTYRISHRLAAAFRDGPVFLSGDAAHVHSPVGAQGMNTGLQDAHNLACKLADVLQGRAGDDWLDRYEAERRPVARRLVATTDALFAGVTSQRRLARAARRVVPPVAAPLAVRVLPRLSGASRIFGYLSQTRIHYRVAGSPDGRRGRVVGRRLPWSGENGQTLRSFRWQVHSYGHLDPAVEGRLRGELDLDVATFPPADRATGLREGLLYLVRPDGFVAAAADGGSSGGRVRACTAGGGTGCIAGGGTGCAAGGGAGRIAGHGAGCASGRGAGVRP